ncbi:hypothetical protein [Kribbella sp. HUAS MG21]|uniref:N-sulphoglucosamine sulphohydrolase C-terminal domain-containing protein n=1 Tax=Kribbella sp. HUAS MG21 TaxID=3160966 RepID=A0AAU7T5M3_9ACTN
MFPTLCELIGEKIPEGVQGRSLLPVLKGEETADFGSIYVEQGVGTPYRAEDLGDRTPGVRREADGRLAVDTVNEVTQSGVRRMVRAGRWKLLAEPAHTQLFDLSTDPFELRDVADQEPGVLRNLQAELKHWETRLSAANL